MTVLLLYRIDGSHFRTCKIKCGAAALDVADRQNAHSATLAVRAVVRAMKREKELHQEILTFSISHDNSSVRIYGHHALIDQEQNRKLNAVMSF